MSAHGRRTPYDGLSIAVRERTLAEISDLAVLLARRHGLRLAVLAAIGAAPWLALDLRLVGAGGGADGAAATWLVVLLVAQAPLATAPITAFLGDAMFSPRPTVRGALAGVGRRCGALLLLAVYRGAYAAVPVAVLAPAGFPWLGLAMLFLLMFYPLHAVEVVLLEGQRLGRSLRRAHELMASWRSEATSQLALAAVVVVAGSLVAVGAGATIIELLFPATIAGDEWWRWFDPARSWLPLLLPWPFMAWLAVARFLSYIDLRTRREGWEVEVALRRAGARLEPAAEP